MLFSSEFLKRLCAVFFIIQLIALTSYGQDFITKWAFQNPTSSIQFSALTTDSVDYSWTAIPSGNNGSGRFSIKTPGQITLGEMQIEAGDTVILKMAPQHLNRFFFHLSSYRENILDVLQWGAVSWTSMEYAFYRCKFLDISASDRPDLARVESMSAMFLDAELFNQNINNWDVSNVTDMSFMFGGAESFNGKISDWDVSNVMNMHSMFSNAYAFNQEIGNWDVSNVTDMESMFSAAYTFNKDIGNWDVSKVEDMWYMFNHAESFNQDISSWDVSLVTRMREMFLDATSFNGNIGNWNVSNVTDMRGMFENATSFDQNINDWDVSSVVYMSGMFKGAISFDHPLNKWNVSKVTEMDEMFNRASSFNQDIGDWDVSNVTSMRFIFYQTSSFNQDIGKWDVSKVVDMSYMFAGSNFNQPIHKWDVSNVEDMRGMFLYTDFNQNLGDWKLNPNVRMNKMLPASGLDCNHYSATLIGWQQNNPNVTDVTLGVVDLRYGTNAADARDTLVSYQSWNIIGDEAVNAACDGLVNTEIASHQDHDQPSIYPNPTTGLMHVEGHSPEFTEVRLVNSVGMDVTSQISITKRNSTSLTLDLRNLQAGVYYLQTKSSSGIVLKK